MLRLRRALRALCPEVQWLESNHRKRRVDLISWCTTEITTNYYKMLKQKESLPLRLYELKFSKIIIRLLLILKRIEQILLLIPFFYPKKTNVFSALNIIKSSFLYFVANFGLREKMANRFTISWSVDSTLRDL